MNFEDNKELFVEEARDLMSSIEKDLLELEREPVRMDLVHNVFRSLHTIKGSGAMFGFDAIAQFTHGLENMFDDIRKGSLSVSKEIVSAVLRSLDCIASLLEKGVAHEMQAGLEKEIAALRGSAPKPAAAAAAPEAPSGTEPGLTNVYRIYFKPNRDLLHRGVKLENLFQELGEKGELYVCADADAVPALEDLEPTDLYLSWVVNFSSTMSEVDLSSVFIFVEDYATIRIETLPVTDRDGRPSVPRIGELLAGRGALAPEDIAEIRQEQKPFGELALQSGKVTKRELDAALAEQDMARSASLEREAHRESASIRVRKEKLDYLIDAVGELVILQARLREEARLAGSPSFGGIAENLARLTSDLRDATMNIRMVPLAESFSGFQRLVRDLGAQLGKDLRLSVRGADTELDKNIIESLKDPLMHIIRNSADHGIEAPDKRERLGKPRTGTISIEARQQGSKVEIDIADDGAGLDLEKIRAKGVERGLIDASERDPKRLRKLIFEPGFSTAERTTGVSGRGVGMDVVKSNLERLRGDISIESEPGKGTRMLLSIPLTLVIVDGLLVRVGGVSYVLTLNQVEECVDMTDDMAAGGRSGRIMNLRGRTIPIISLREVFGMPPDEGAAERRLVIVDAEGTTVALRVDGVVGKQQVVIKPFTMDLRQVPTIAGATILGDGSVAFILNIREVVKSQRGEERRVTKERV